MRILLILSVLLAGTGTLFLYWYDQAQQACDQISDQCADAGFAWEASGKLLLIAASLILLTLSSSISSEAGRKESTRKIPGKLKLFLRLEFGGVSLAPA